LNFGTTKTNGAGTLPCVFSSPKLHILTVCVSGVVSAEQRNNSLSLCSNWDPAKLSALDRAQLFLIFFVSKQRCRVEVGMDKGIPARVRQILQCPKCGGSWLDLDCENESANTRIPLPIVCTDVILSSVCPRMLDFQFPSGSCRGELRLQVACQGFRAVLTEHSRADKEGRNAFLFQSTG